MPKCFGKASTKLSRSILLSSSWSEHADRGDGSSNGRSYSPGSDSLLGNLRMERRRYHASLRNSPRTWYDPSNDGTATVQHASPRTSRGRVSAVISGDWTWDNEL